MEQVLFVTRSDGRPTGDAFVQFATEEEGQRALTKHKNSIGTRYIELFRSTPAEVQQVIKRSNELSTNSSTSGNKPRECIRLRGLPFEAQVQHVVEFLGEHARNIQYQGVHMVFNSQGNPSGEAFIQMTNEQAAAAAATASHNKFMVIGKKQRYIEVFQCSPDDMNLVMPAAAAQPTPIPPPQPVLPVLQQRQFVPNMIPMIWPYPSPPVSPNLLLPGQLHQLLVQGIRPGMGVADIIAQFQNHDVVIENVIFTRMPAPTMPGEAIVIMRARTPTEQQQLIHIDPQFLAKADPQQFMPGLMQPAMLPTAALPAHQPVYTVM
ncbi:hypothetical protein WR25_17285 [Diploscapter pachys]|uniref:RRM domain-containing protein n=1 Tax=Diploscapter pachys TaxID=2018661 RepID=A0A2A2L1G2_9BILA|nr:hypothetical protein WR25_17285 [Diploscapter pachys]